MNTKQKQKQKETSKKVVANFLVLQIHYFDEMRHLQGGMAVDIHYFEKLYGAWAVRGKVMPSVNCLHISCLLMSLQSTGAQQGKGRFYRFNQFLMINFHAMRKVICEGSNR